MEEEGWKVESEGGEQMVSYDCLLSRQTAVLLWRTQSAAVIVATSSISADSAIYQPHL